MKVKVIKEAYYNDRLVKPDEIIEFSGKKLPSWAEKCSEESEKIKEDDKVKEADSGDNSSLSVSNANENPQEIQGDNLLSVQDNNNLTEEEKRQYLDVLINEGIDKGILIDDADTKPIDEQIKELEAALNKIKNEGE